MMLKMSILAGGALLGLSLAAGLLVIFFKQKFQNRINQWFTQGRFLEGVTLFKRIPFQKYLETMMRGSTGKPLERPFGTPIHLFWMDRIQFKPVYLTRSPLSSKVAIDTQVILGPQAQKPLVLKIPVMVGGWSISAVSLKTKLALAKASVLSGTATNCGSGPYVEEVRAEAEKYILQYTRGFWSKSESILKKADMIEIALGQGAWGSAPKRMMGYKVTPGFAGRLETIPGLDLLVDSRLPEVESFEDWKALINRLKEISGGVPIGVKFGGTHYLEEELELMIKGGVDLIVLDGKEGGTHAGPPLLLDDVGMATFPSLCRAARFLEQHNLKGKVSLIIGGGLFTPGDFLKCLALGADAVIVGTIAALTMSNVQLLKSIPWEPPTEILYRDGKKADRFDPDQGAINLNNYFQSCVAEMKAIARSLGKSSLKDIGRDDLVSLDPLYAEAARVETVNSDQ
jgi:glutamate synthase domain-containing protein 2